MGYTGSVHIDGVSPISLIAGWALSAPYLALKLDATKKNTVVLAGAGDDALFAGISQDVTPTKAGEHIALKPFGFTLATAGGTVVVGDYLKIAANGKLIATATATNKVVAQAFSAGVTDDYIEVKLLNGYSVI